MLDNPKAKSAAPGRPFSLLSGSVLCAGPRAPCRGSRLRVVCLHAPTPLLPSVGSRAPRSNSPLSQVCAEGPLAAATPTLVRRALLGRSQELAPWPVTSSATCPSRAGLGQDLAVTEQPPTSSARTQGFTIRLQAPLWRCCCHGRDLRPGTRARRPSVPRVAVSAAPCGKLWVPVPVGVAGWPPHTSGALPRPRPAGHTSVLEPRLQLEGWHRAGPQEALGGVDSSDLTRTSEEA